MKTESPVCLGTIEMLAKEYDRYCALLESELQDLQEQLNAVKKEFMPGLKQLAAHIAAAESTLQTAIGDAPELFTKPRTFILHGVKVGFTISQGRVVWDVEEDKLIANIRRHLTGNAGDFINTKEAPDKDALRALTPEEQRRIGVRIEGAGDVVVCKRVAGEVEALMDKLIAKMSEAMTEAA